ncbi:thyrotropin-releasing hormone receptor-like [Schistocerca serialis cubense]|uniref:thyrotropin-releasing hormone receptor-like n=1 Tax=Schistocerca serialis cubense TaxID=2023355 RepID=UPI00214E2EEF|nr:thyrotropin-releasing hormone receptor-like [Schistocerca serialis cubense]
MLAPATVVPLWLGSRIPADGVSLAVADCLVLVASVPNEILSYYLVGNQWLWGDVGCAAFVFCQNLGINASALSLVAFTVERYIAICRPLRAHALCSVSRAQRISLLAWALAAAYSAPWLALTSTRPLRYRGLPELRACDFRLPRAHYLLYFFCDLLAFYVAPLLLSCVLYALIARALFRRGAAASVVKMLAAVVVVFATLWLPYRGLLVYNSFATLFSGTKYMDLWFLLFAKTCVFINSAINPILYNAMSGKFRRAFRKTLVRCARRLHCGIVAVFRQHTSKVMASDLTVEERVKCAVLAASTQFRLGASPVTQRHQTQRRDSCSPPTSAIDTQLRRL